MSALSGTFWFWMNSVADTLVEMIGKIRSPRHVRVFEEDDDSFRLELPDRAGDPASGGVQRFRIANGEIVGTPPSAVLLALQGSRTELLLRPTRFLFRPLELPRRAAEFLDGIVRAQIDRLTPWSATDAAFGWTAPQDLAGDRIALTIGATARARIAPYLEALARLGASSVVVLTVSPGSAAGAAPIRIAEQKGSGAFDVDQMRRMLVVLLAIAGLAATLATGAGLVVGGSLDDQKRDVALRISERRAAMRRDGLGGAAPALQAIERRKHETPSSVIVLEALSQILPDHTYVTELRVESDKLQIIGITQDAPSLIRLIEQSPHFTRATFFAPTTRSAGDPGERFSIEVRINPVFAVHT